MTVKQGVRRIIIKKTIILLCIAAVLSVFCYFASSHEKMPDFNNSRLIYIMFSVGISLAVLVFIAYKMRYFNTIFGTEWTGTVIKVDKILFNGMIRQGFDMRQVNDLSMLIQIDNRDECIELRFPLDKVGNNVYFVGDRVHLLKGTRYPINLTCEAEQHICPICGHDSCLDDMCPNCKVKY